MGLTTGTRLGPYEIVSAVGAGGMGEVYRARDTRLKRDVALKILPESFVHDSERLARFQREAEVLASINHPHIAAIYGIEDADGVRALVLELVEGETLADRIARGPIPIDEALPIAKQIAEAFEAAHEQRIIHRDLKPANIKVTPDGVVKVLDFGLAKLAEGPATAGPTALSMSPTITSPAMMTGVGVLLGTAAYMSPEQAKGREADKRSDIWAFGCVLYEMLSGRRAFEGEDVSDTLASVLRGEPDWNTLPSDVPVAIRALLKGCLTKDRRARIADISTALFVMNEPAILAPAASTGPSPSVIVARPSMRRRAAGWTAGLVACAITGTGVWFITRPISPRVTRTIIATSGAAMLSVSGFTPDVAITPDGTRVVYVGNNGSQLFVRALDALEPVAIATGTRTPPRNPFVSPDGQWVGFAETSQLRKVAITGGPTITLARLDGVGARGASWSRDDTIVFATDDLATGLQRVSSAGGSPTVLTRPHRERGEVDHLWPEVLPGGRAVLFTITMQQGGLEAAQIAVLDLATGTEKVVVRGGSHAHFLASGHLMYTAAGALRAVPFDLSRLEVRGVALPVVPHLVTTASGAGDFALATDGTLVYADAPSGFVNNARTLVWVDRAGKEEQIPAPPRAYNYPRVSPDGTRIALDPRDQENDLWMWDLRRATLTRLTFEPGSDQNPVWTPDGRRLVFASDRAGGELNLWWQAVDGTGAAERLTTSHNRQLPVGTSPDGSQIIFTENTPTTGTDLMRLLLDNARPSTISTPGRETPLLQTKFLESNGIISPDGRWLAYESDSSGRREIYVRPFPTPGAGQWQVSNAGGTQPLWARSGTELFFLGLDNALMRAPVETSGATWNAGTPAKLLDGNYFQPGGARPYDVSPDGQRFLMIKPSRSDAAAARQIIVVQRFDQELKRLVPLR